MDNAQQNAEQIEYWYGEAGKRWAQDDDPVKSDFGYHVIQLDDSRPMTPPPFDQVKPQLQQRAGQQQVETLVKELRGKAKVD